MDYKIDRITFMSIVDIIKEGAGEGDHLSSAQKVCDLIEKELSSSLNIPQTSIITPILPHTGATNIQEKAQSKKPRHARKLTSLGVRDDAGNIHSS